MNRQPIPVDGKGLDWPRRVANAINGLFRTTDDHAAQLATVGTGFGFIDYTDTESPTAISLPAGDTVQVLRTLAASTDNNRLRSVFTGHAFWAANKITPRALYDVIQISIFIRIVPGASNGALDVSLMAGAIEIAAKAFPLTGTVGAGQGLRADFIIPVRGMFLANGAKVMLRSSVTATVTEFSPEFYPLGYEP